MNSTLTITELQTYIISQINNFIPDGKIHKRLIKEEYVELALSKCDFCFKHIRNNAFCDENGVTSFSHLHADQYGMFLVYLSNLIWKETQDRLVCDRLMYLNRILHGFMMSYKAKVPNIFWLAHPVGSVIGNADYSDFLYVSQNCTINTAGDNENLKPKIGKFFAMGAGAAVIGDKDIGDYCSIGVNALLYDRELKNNSIVISKNGHIEIISSKKESFAEKMFYNF